MKGRALVAWNLRRIRAARGLSQERLAFDAGVDRSYVGGLEREEENPTVDVLDRLARTLSIHISEFFVEPAKGASPPAPLRRGRRPSRQPQATIVRRSPRGFKSSRGGC
jgi:transcriptional regulator with XRE-family HTH domain